MGRVTAECRSKCKVRGLADEDHGDFERANDGSVDGFSAADSLCAGV
jgi:hypothetical protein